MIINLNALDIIIFEYISHKQEQQTSRLRMKRIHPGKHFFPHLNLLRPILPLGKPFRMLKPDVIVSGGHKAKLKPGNDCHPLSVSEFDDFLQHVAIALLSFESRIPAGPKALSLPQ